MHRFLINKCSIFIGSPTEFLGYELGTQFTRHHQVVSYFNSVAAATEQVKLSTHGCRFHTVGILLEVKKETFHPATQQVARS